MRLISFIVTGFIFFSFAGCSSSRHLKKQASSFGQLRFINEYIVPNALSVKGTVVGGLSGIDYDPGRDQYYLICDDPSAFSPARFYTAKIGISEKGIDTIYFPDVTTILNPAGEPYPDIRKDRTHSADLEAMRYDPRRDELIRCSEGQRVIINKDSMQLQNPDIVIMGRNGRYKDSFALPANMHIRSTDNGPRHNSVFEGVSFNSDQTRIYVSVEDAIYEDGAKAATGDSTAWVRFLEFDRNTRLQTAQYAYMVDPVPYPANPPGAFKINGVSDILYIGNYRMLVIERAWSTGRVPSDIRVYFADLKGASDISAVASLQKNPPARPISKKLLFNMSDLGRTIYNVEGVTFGPKLPNGHSTLIFVVDDNFSKTERSQFLLFEIIP